MLDAAQFRLIFPAFASTSAYGDAMIGTWLTYAAKLINVERWADLADMGQGLITAHHLVLETQAVAAANRRGVPGGTVGILTSKSAGGVSASYDSSSATNQGAGHWNQTTYGTRFWQLSRMMGAGPVQVGTASLPSVSAWSGPLMPL